MEASLQLAFGDRCSSRADTVGSNTMRSPSLPFSLPPSFPLALSLSRSLSPSVDNCNLGATPLFLRGKPRSRSSPSPSFSPQRTSLLIASHPSSGYPPTPFSAMPV